MYERGNEVNSQDGYAHGAVVTYCWFTNGGCYHNGR